jgi:hypothetical protein
MKKKGAEDGFFDYLLNVLAVIPWCQFPDSVFKFLDLLGVW